MWKSNRSNHTVFEVEVKWILLLIEVRLVSMQKGNELGRIIYGGTTYQDVQDVLYRNSRFNYTWWDSCVSWKTEQQLLRYTPYSLLFHGVSFLYIILHKWCLKFLPFCLVLFLFYLCVIWVVFCRKWRG